MFVLNLVYCYADAKKINTCAGNCTPSLLALLYFLHVPSGYGDRNLLRTRVTHRRRARRPKHSSHLPGTHCLASTSISTCLCMTLPVLLLLPPPPLLRHGVRLPETNPRKPASSAHTDQSILRFAFKDDISTYTNHSDRNKAAVAFLLASGPPNSPRPAKRLA